MSVVTANTGEGSQEPGGVAAGREQQLGEDGKPKNSNEVSLCVSLSHYVSVCMYVCVFVCLSVCLCVVCVLTSFFLLASLVLPFSLIFHFQTLIISYFFIDNLY